MTKIKELITSKKYFMFSLRESILLVFLPIFFVLSGFLILYDLKNDIESAVRAASELISSTSENIIEKAHNIVGTPMAMVNMSAELPGLENGLESIDRGITDYFMTGLEDFPNLYGIFVAYPNGDFLQALQMAKLDTAGRERLGVPDGTAFALRVIARSPSDGRTEIWRFLDSTRTEIARRVNERPLYDPRTRAWYQQAMAEDNVVLSDAYVFASLQRPGLTLSRQVTGGEGIVIAADIPLSELSTFLQRQVVSPQSVVLVYNKKGEIIAHPDLHRTFQVRTIEGGDETTVLPVKIQDLGDTAVALAYQRLVGDGNRNFLFDFNDEKYVASFTPIPGTYGAGLNIAIVAPAEDFLAPFTDKGRKSLLFSSLVLLISIPLLIAVAQRISRPVRELVEEADKIRHFQLDGTPKIGSRVEEIRNLEESIAAMKSTIQTFSYYVPKSLVQQLIESGVSPQLGGVERSLTILFTDVANFTELSEDTPPQDLMQRVSAYLERISRNVLENNGTIDKFIGDAVMAFWNAPSAEHDHVRKACATMLLCKAEIDNLNVDWEASGLPPMFTRFGLHTGSAIVGNVGSSDRMNYTAVGSTVNLAARIEKLNKEYGTQLLVSEAVVRLASASFLFRPVDTIPPRGAQTPVTIFELMGGLAGPEHLRASPEQVRYAAAWQDAYEYFQAGDWNRALGGFSALRDTDPDDPLASLYVDKTLAEIKKDPPAPTATG